MSQEASGVWVRREILKMTRHARNSVHQCHILEQVLGGPFVEASVCQVSILQRLLAAWPQVNWSEERHDQLS